MAICDASDSTHQSTIILIDENKSFFTSDESEAGQRLCGALSAMRDGLLRVTGKAS